MVDRKQIETLVKEKLTTALQKRDSVAQPLAFINEKIILGLTPNTTVSVIPRVIITPSARDIAEQMGISFQTTAEIPIADIEKINPKTIVIGTDHGGFSLKEILKKELREWGYEVLDIGTHTSDAVDYPDFAHAVASIIGRGYCERGIIIDGAGIGSAIVANKVQGIRAAHCRDLSEVKNSREHNNANILTLGARIIGVGLALDMVKMWLTTSFEGGRHQRRIDKISDIEQREMRCRT